MEIPSQFAEARHGKIFRDGSDRHQPVALAVLGNQPKSSRDAAANVIFANGAALYKNPAGRHRMTPHHAFKKLAASRAHEPVDPKNFSGANGPRNVVDGIAAGDAGEADVFRPKSLIAEGMLAGRREVFGVRSNHLPDDPVNIDVRHCARAGDAPVAQYSNEIADT